MPRTATRHGRTRSGVRPRAGSPGGRLPLAVGVAAVLAVAACSDSPTAPAASGTAPSASAGPSAGGVAPEKPITDYLQYVGGTAGAADPAAAPIVIGWVNVEGGPIGSTPEATRGAQAAVAYVNEKLGGIGGRPLELKVCAITTAEEEGRTCGQQMLDDASVQAVAFGNVFLGDTSYNSVLAGRKPLVVGVATGPSVATTANAFVLFGDLTHVFAPWGTYARDSLKARTAALVHTNAPGDTAAAAAVRRGLESAGITVTAVAFDAQATDLLGPVTAAGAQAADVIVPIAQGQGCVGIAKALVQLGNTKPVAATPVCLTADVAQGNGGDLPQWTYGIAQTLPSDASAPDAKAYHDASAAAGLSSQDAGQVFAALAWSEILTYAKVLNELGPDKVTPDAVAARLKAFAGPVVMGAPEVRCGQFHDAPAVCNSLATFYAYRGKGSFAQVAGWLRPPA
jgi:branched-chain amino acid transport system substrate-binding protein